MSFAVTTTNSSQLIPGPKLIFLILPRGMLLRTVAPYSMFGSEMSSMYRARPVTLSRPSFRGADTPIVAGDLIVRSRYCERKPLIFVRLIAFFALFPEFPAGWLARKFAIRVNRLAAH